MRIAITNPFVWPFVRRGSERLLDNLARDLHARGHEVTVFAMGNIAADEIRDGVRYRLLQPRLGATPRQFNHLHYFAFALQRALRHADLDVVFCLNYFDCYAALRARRQAMRSYKVAFMSVGIPTRAYFRAVPLDAWFMRSVLREADLLLVLSRFAQDRLSADFDVNADVLPPPVFTAQFSPPCAAPLPSPVGPRLLFVGDVDEQRKGARALCRVFPSLRAAWPGAELVFAGRVSEHRQTELLAELRGADCHDAVRFTGLGRLDDLPGLYQSAAVTVLPAVWEAFGLVLVESLASGTPVVGANHGGIPDIVDSGRIGRVFDPGALNTGQTDNLPALAEAIQAVLEIGKTPEVQRACRMRAEAFSWTTLGPEYETRLIDLVADSEPCA